MKSGAPCWEAKAGEAENSRHRLNLTLIWKEDTKAQISGRQSPHGASFSRLSTSHCKRPEGVIPSTHTKINQAPAAPTQRLAPEGRQLLSQAGTGAASQLQVCGGSQGEAAPNSEGCGSLTRITMEPVQGAGTSCPRPPQSFGCHQPEVNRFCSSNKLVTKATVLIPKCN